jgi:hypothetical protein
MSSCHNKNRVSFEDLEDMETIKKKVKPDTNKEDDNDWIVVKKQESPLSICMSDYSKVNRYYSHKSLQNYLRYLLAKTCPNPMWLSIKRQSLIEHILYIDLEIENNLFEKLI